jgi:hypothetical protein
MPKSYHRVTTCIKRNNRSWEIRVGVNDASLPYSTLVGQGVDPLDATIDALIKRLPTEAWEAMRDRALERITPAEVKARSNVRELDARLATIDAGIKASRTAQQAAMASGDE